MAYDVKIIYNSGNKLTVTLVTGEEVKKLITDLNAHNPMNIWITDKGAKVPRLVIWPNNIDYISISEQTD